MAESLAALGDMLMPLRVAITGARRRRTTGRVPYERSADPVPYQYTLACRSLVMFGAASSRYPLMPLMAIPSTNCFCKARNRINEGRNVITAPAITRP